MIVLFTDFGLAGPYTGQMKAVLARRAPQVPVIDLLADAPACEPRLSAYLLAAYAASPVFQPGEVFLCVVDPGVGTDRRPLVVAADRKWFVGPDNGLFDVVIRRAKAARAWAIDWRPMSLSATFHGRDLFAPVAAQLALGDQPPGMPVSLDAIARPDWPDDLPRIVYVDTFGNALTGLRASVLGKDAVLTVAGHRIRRSRTFADVPAGEPLWYANANGLAEIAVNRGRADAALGLGLGMAVEVSAGS